jgi:hypothetical protein
VTFNSCGNTSMTVFGGYSTPDTTSALHMDDFSIAAASGSPPSFARAVRGCRPH